MFKSFKFSRLKNNNYIYYLIDSEFTCSEVLTFEPPATNVAATILVRVVIREYKKRNLPVAKNVALLYFDSYKKGFKIDGWLEYDKELLDAYYPKLEYGKKYYKCVLNQIRMLKYSVKCR